MTFDAYKKMNIKYNELNLPTEIIVANSGTLKNYYDPYGALLYKEKYDLNGTILTTTYYSGNFQYENVQGTTQVKYIFNDVGYTTVDNQKYENH